MAPRTPRRTTAPALPAYTHADLAGRDLHLPPAVADISVGLSFGLRSDGHFYGALDPSGVADGPPIVHTLTVDVDADSVASLWLWPDAPAGTAADTWARLTAIPGLAADLDATDPRFPRERVVVARLDVAEFPSHLVQAAAASWWDVLDGEDTATGEMVQALVRRPATMTLLGGSLYLFRLLHVHPAFRGQRLGARLLAHAVWLYVTDEADLAVLDAIPIESPSAGGEPDRSPAAIEGLAAYYARVGFRRWRRRRAKQGEAVRMYLEGGQRHPFDLPNW